MFAIPWPRTFRWGVLTALLLALLPGDAAAEPLVLLPWLAAVAVPPLLPFGLVPVAPVATTTALVLLLFWTLDVPPLLLALFLLLLLLLLLLTFGCALPALELFFGCCFEDVVAAFTNEAPTLR
jgi:hypothetical protein